MIPESENPPQPDAQPATEPATTKGRKGAKPTPQPDAKPATEPATTKGRKGAKPTPQPDAKPATEPEPDAEPAALTADDVMPESSGRRDAAALALLFDACERFNVNPGMQVRPRELAGWRYYSADRVEGVPAAVVIVTAGGLKLKYFDGDVVADADTEERLRATFRAFTIDPKTKERVPAPLPADLSLPAEAVLGQPASAAHRHPLGYLRRAR